MVYTRFVLLRMFRRLGHLLTVDSLGPATGSIVSLLALLSGTWFPVADSGFLHDIAQALPSYWLTQASLTWRWRLVVDGLARRCSVDGGARPAGTDRLPSRHAAGVAAPSPPPGAPVGACGPIRSLTACAACPSHR
jgi:hypothetical protein